MAIRSPIHAAWAHAQVSGPHAAPHVRRLLAYCAARPCPAACACPGCTRARRTPRTWQHGVEVALQRGRQLSLDAGLP